MYYVSCIKREIVIKICSSHEKGVEYVVLQVIMEYA